MKRFAIVLALLVCAPVAASSAGADSVSSSQPAAVDARAASCAASRKAVTTFKRKIAKARKAYFKRVKSAKKRKAFVRKQKAKLKKLQSAAARACRTAGAQPQPQPQPPSPPPPAPPAPAPQPELPNPDRDGDGYANDVDCAPDDAAINPGAVDNPDVAFRETNCDGIDGTEANAIFVSPLGHDASPGTKAAPLRTLQAGVDVAMASSKQVYVTAGTFDHVYIGAGVGIYGGYGPESWQRTVVQQTLVVGSPEGVLIGATGVILQHLTVRGNAAATAGSSAYGIRLMAGTSAKLEQVAVRAGSGTAGATRGQAPNGAKGGDGQGGWYGYCDEGSYIDGPSRGGNGGTGATAGGRGGNGGDEAAGANGSPGQGYPFGYGGVGGDGGAAGDPGRDGKNGWPGTAGSPGANGTGGSGSTAGASTGWSGRAGQTGSGGTPGTGGGGGGGGGGEDCTFCIAGAGGGGGGGGAGGSGGPGGQGGAAAGGSFGIYLYNATVVISETSSIETGDGGRGGNGGSGGGGGAGGVPGPGRGQWSGDPTCNGKEIGTGGMGGFGGTGGRGGGGGGGAGGPSVGVFKAGSSTADVQTAAISVGSPGAGGNGGGGGTGVVHNGQAGIAATVYP